MILMSMFSSLDQQDILLKTWCVPLVLYYSGAQETCSFQHDGSTVCRSVGKKVGELAACSKSMNFVNRDNWHD